MSSLGMADCRRLARKVRGIDVVLVSGERNHSDPPERVRSTLLVASGSRGKFVVQVDMPADGTAAGARFIPVEKNGPAHEVVEELVAETEQRYQSPDFEEAGPEAVP